ncbi:hypothetical protein CVT26_002553 [Gymnopilus dilepis]|uniref:DNA2/NAM7 helicase-like C-terminal domain-containing protein n=1 Tax=Gymnopilus dilepis TaxID=231916 RepID=A0A409Y3Q6_9AGAR|nr:hypothetical protein CVT26_002553 [Gymnopilus dilepis]
MAGKRSITATDLAAHQHFRCDLYLHNVYHGRSVLGQDCDTRGTSTVSRAHLKRGIDWEASLLSWLEKSNLLLRVPPRPIKSDGLLENILADERTHFFITGLSFWPPQHNMDQRFSQEGSEPLVFGLAKPDLLEILKTKEGILWRVIDAKASKRFNTSHQVQVYFYTLCLNDLLRNPPFQSTDTAGVWLSPSASSDMVTPSMSDIKKMSISLLAPIFNTLLFKELPKVIGLPYDEVDWHYNPLCRGCRFEHECRVRATDEGTIGSMPNVSIDDAHVLKDLLRISRGSSRPPLERPLPEIEELHKLFEDDTKLDLLAKSPVALNKARQILSVPKNSSSMQGRLGVCSPVVEASRSRRIQVVPRRSTTCPNKEDIAIVISVVDDPSSPTKVASYFCATIHSENASIIWPPMFMQSSSELVSKLGHLIRSIESRCSQKTCQFYVWSSSEWHTLQSAIIEAALTSNLPPKDIQACIGALSEGASLLHTTFQPILLSGALLSFLKYSKRTRVEYETCLGRLGLPTEGSIKSLQERLTNGIRQLQAVGSSSHEGRRKEIGQLSHVVVLKREIERQLALPIPGHWDLQECVHLLLPTAKPCPSNDEILLAYKNIGHDGEHLQGLLISRNRLIYRVLLAFRDCATAKNGASYLVNEAKVLSPRFMDICKEEHTRKLFFVQQFEVLAKLAELWQPRIDGCPDAPVLQYDGANHDPHGTELVFRLLSGTVDSPAPETFFDKLLVRSPPRLSCDDEDIPVEALFDDLSVSGLVFPLNIHTELNWSNQEKRVQRDISVADVRNIFPSRDKKHTMVALRVWNAGQPEFRKGETYRLCPRLVDFNTSKVLANLLEIDILWDCEQKVSHRDELHQNLPFLQLIMDSNSLGQLPMAKEYLKRGNELQNLFGELRGGGNVPAEFLVLKPSQHKAAQRILSYRLSTIWGPPGTGKTHTICLSLLRLIYVQYQYHRPLRAVIFITAVTHAAIEACCKKLKHLIGVYASVSTLSRSWLDKILIQIVRKGRDHSPPPPDGTCIHVPSKLTDIVVDEAGQVSLALISLVIRYLSHQGRIIIAGDSEQLAPIFNARYPLLKQHALFGSVLDCLMHPKVSKAPSIASSRLGDVEDGQQLGGHVIQLNPDLADFISLIYPRQLRPQKAQARTVAEDLGLAANKGAHLAAFPKEIVIPIQNFFVGLSCIMLAKEYNGELLAPAIKSIHSVSRCLTESFPPFRPISLALIRLRSWSKHLQSISYDMHVQIEAALAAVMVVALQACCPDDSIFVATPHRIQREAVKRALTRVMDDNDLISAFGQMDIAGKTTRSAVTVDTVERLQGSEASFVICLFSLPKFFTTGDLSFLLDRRRLNVAFSRAKSMCILISSDEVLRPPPKVLSDETVATGYAFLKAYQQRAWSYKLAIQAEKVL